MSCSRPSRAWPFSSTKTAPILQAAFPDMLGSRREAYLNWFAERAGPEAGVTGPLAQARPNAVSPPPAAAPAMAAGAGNGRSASAGGCRSAGARAALPHGLPPGLAGAARAAPADQPGLPPAHARSLAATRLSEPVARRTPAAVALPAAGRWPHIHPASRSSATCRPKAALANRPVPPARTGLHRSATRRVGLPRRQCVAHGRERGRGAGQRPAARHQPVPHQRRPVAGGAHLPGRRALHRHLPHRVLGLGAGELPARMAWRLCPCGRSLGAFELLPARHRARCRRCRCW
jgi:hypothetical protein